MRIRIHNTAYSSPPPGGGIASTAGTVEHISWYGLPAPLSMRSEGTHTGIEKSAMSQCPKYGTACTGTLFRLLPASITDWAENFPQFLDLL
jgi:hypothetical protein